MDKKWKPDFGCRCFMLFAKIERFAQDRYNFKQHPALAYKKRAFWAFVEGIGKAGIYWFS